MVRYFYPRSPCGERLNNINGSVTTADKISIHALLAESDVTFEFYNSLCQDFYPRSPCGERHTWTRGSRVTYVISIHALLAESDKSSFGNPYKKPYFYPRSPGGERQLMPLIRFSRGIFLSTLSLRRATGIGLVFLWWGVRFLSTLSLRRATDDLGDRLANYCISIHALLAESDAYPERYAREQWAISIHALLAESDCDQCMTTRNAWISIHALLAESDQCCSERLWPFSQFLSTLSLRRATKRRPNRST